VQQPNPGQQEKANDCYLSVLEPYVRIDSFGLELRSIVHGHERIDHMSFNDDDKYRALVNEVSLVNYRG
jgi:hypothetical protein